MRCMIKLYISMGFYSDPGIYWDLLRLLNREEYYA